MTESHSGSAPPGALHEVADPEQAKLLTDSVAKEFFKPFLARERTATQAAEAMGCNLNTMLYRIKTFLDVGLLEVTRTQKRAGRPIKHYRSVHDAYFIPFALTPYAELEERLMAQLGPLFEQTISSLARVYRESDHDGQRIFRDQQGTVWTDPFANLADERGAVKAFDHLDFDDPVAMYRDIGLYLTKAEARALRLRLNELFADAYRRQWDGDQKKARGKQYMLQVGLVPLERS